MTEEQTAKLQRYREWLREELQLCISFWLEKGMDPKYGGIYTCLDRKGEIYSTDKSVWMQGRAGWTFSALCRCYGVRDEWLEAARSCLDFMEQHCINRSAGNRMYFTVTADGRPLRQRRYCFSEGFYCIAHAEYYGVTGDRTCLERARAAYELIYQLHHGLIPDPTGLGPKTIPETRSGRTLADPMIYLNTTAVLRRCDPERSALYDERAKECCDTILRFHYRPELGCTLENVGLNGETGLDYTAGRIVNPGHDIECSWFLMEEARYEKNPALFRKAQHIFDQAWQQGWDREYGGLLYFTDCKGLPPEAYEHDMKLWWTHNELLIASLMLFRDLGEERYFRIFEETLDYCREVFSDRAYGEWYGYLRRDGKPTLPSTKGSTFKGPFHLPRMLMMTEQMIGEMLKQNES